MTDLNVYINFDKNSKSFDMTLHDVDGSTHKGLGSATKKVAVYFESSNSESMVTMNDNRTSYTVAGKNGYGIQSS